MEEEIDLREYINVIVRRWKWIVGITLAAVVTAGIVSFLVLAPSTRLKREWSSSSPSQRSLSNPSIAP